MSGPPGPWSATVSVSTGRPELTRWVEEALRPEAAREVPRARTEVRRLGSRLELRIDARDAGAMRAALNTYLGWISLSLETAEASAGRPAASAAAPAHD
jgi:tRNA threonylcarbamoyladenosine modification (KEOPS) complex  Pcc1 subunit